MGWRGAVAAPVCGSVCLTGRYRQRVRFTCLREVSAWNFIQLCPAARLGKTLLLALRTVIITIIMVVQTEEKRMGKKRRLLEDDLDSLEDEDTGVSSGSDSEEVEDDSTTEDAELSR